jgi:Mn2+/Fe2+ NRAMP family transporter
MRSCLTPLFAIMAKKVQQVRRDRLTIGMIAGIPLLLITLLRGAELDQLLPDLLALVAFLSVALMLAVLRFKKRLD